MSTANLTRAETADRARHVRVHAYTVDIDVRDAAEAAVHTFPVTSSITLTSRSRQTWLDFIGEVDAPAAKPAAQTVSFAAAALQADEKAYIDNTLAGVSDPELKEILQKTMSRSILRGRKSP